jgi:hypothetical protein
MTESVRSFVAKTLRSWADLVESKPSPSSGSLLPPNIPSEMPSKHRRLLLDHERTPYGPDHIQKRAVETATEVWAEYQANYTVDISEFTVFASQLTGKQNLDVEYLPEGQNYWANPRSYALDAARVISELGYCPTRTIALEQLGDKQPGASRRWMEMEDEAREAGIREAEASGAGTEVDSTPAKTKGKKKLFED